MLQLVALTVRNAMRVQGCDIDADTALCLARSILLAMHQPTEVMMQAGAKAGDWHPAVGRIDVDCAADVWRAMIDAGISEEP